MVRHKDELRLVSFAQVFFRETEGHLSFSDGPHRVSLVLGCDEYCNVSDDRRGVSPRQLTLTGFFI